MAHVLARLSTAESRPYLRAILPPVCACFLRNDSAAFAKRGVDLVPLIYRTSTNVRELLKQSHEKR